MRNSDWLTVEKHHREKELTELKDYFVQLESKEHCKLNEKTEN